MNSSFAERQLEPQDVPLVVDSFARSYRVIGHVAGLLDRFRETFADPFRSLVQASSAAPDALVSTRIVYPVSEPSEIAGYMVFSPRHKALVYLLVKPAYRNRRVATHLLSGMPTIESHTQVDKRPYLQHVFSTVEFTKLVRAAELRTRYSPFLFMRLAQEATEDAAA